MGASEAKKAIYKRIKEVLLKDPWLETTHLVQRFGVTKDTILKIKKEVYKELNIKPPERSKPKYNTERKEHPWARAARVCAQRRKTKDES